MLEWANEYGGIYKFCLGCQWVVVVSDPGVAAQVGEKKAQDFITHPRVVDIMHVRGRLPQNF
jgi:hypothetical protein